jgi:pyrroline-5-carboxylate reductase
LALRMLIDGGLVPATGVRAVVGTAASAARLAAQHGLAVATDPTEAWQAPVVLLAIKPQLLAAAAEAAPGVTPGGAGAGGASVGAGERPLLISVLAGVTLARLQALFPAHRIVRAVPTTPALVRQGLEAEFDKFTVWPQAATAQQALNP